jgi:hypothetical protein
MGAAATNMTHEGAGPVGGRSLAAVPRRSHGGRALRILLPCLLLWGTTGCHFFQNRPLFGRLRGWLQQESRNPIPERYPLGSVLRSHTHAMQSNAEAVDFILNQNEFRLQTAELTPGGKDHLLEIGARMRSTPYPVIIERTPNNGNPELDAERRYVVARLLYEMGNPDADQRVFVATPYGPGIHSYEGEFEYMQFVNTRNGNNFNRGGAGGAFGNGFGAGGFGGGFFGFGP